MSIGQNFPDTIAKDRCLITKSDDQPLLTTGYESVTFDQEVFDEGDIHDIVINNERIIFKSDVFAYIFFQLELSAVSNTIVRARVLRNGDPNQVLLMSGEQTPVGQADSVILHNAAGFEFIAGDYVVLQALIAAAGNKDILAGNTKFEVAIESHL